MPTLDLKTTNFIYKNIHKELAESISNSCLFFWLVPECFLMNEIIIFDSLKPNLGNLWPYECDKIIGFLNWVVCKSDFGYKKSGGDIIWREGIYSWVSLFLRSDKFRWLPFILIVNFMPSRIFHFIMPAYLSLKIKWIATAPWENPKIPS